MRRKVAALTGLIVVLGLVLPGRVPPHALAQTGNWVPKAPIPIARTAAAAVTGNDGRIYVFGGSDNATQDFRDAEVYDPSTDAWTRIAPLPVAEAYMSAQLGNDGKIYIFGGFDNVAGRSLNTVFAYDPATNTYACSGGYSGCASVSLAPMPTARSTMAIAMTDDGQMWTIGGFSTVPVATVEIYDPVTNTWKEGPPLPSPDAGAAAFSWLGWIVVNGGFDGQQDISTSYLLNANPPSAGRFTRQELPASPAGIQFPPSLWFCNSPNPGGFLNWVEVNINDPSIYKAYYHKWTQDDRIADYELLQLRRRNISLPQFRMIIRDLCNDYENGTYHPVSASLREQAPRSDSTLDAPVASIALAPVVYVGGVDTSGVTSSVGVYDWFTGTVTAGPSLPGPRELAAVVDDDNGTVYVIGGDDGRVAYNTVLTYTPPSVVVPLPTAAPTPTATLPAPTATSTPTATPLLTATATTTPVPLYIHVAVAHKTIAAGKKQTITVQTLPGASVSIAVAYPNGEKVHHTATADGQGLATWSYKQPDRVTRGKNRRAKVTVTARQGVGATVQAKATYTIR